MCLQVLSLSPTLPILIIAFLCYNLPQRDDLKECIIIFSDNAQISSCINKIKEKMLDVFHKVLNYIHTSTTKEEWLTSKFYQYVPQLSEILFKSLDKISTITGQNIQDIFSDQSVHSLYVNCMKCLSLIGGFEVFGDTLLQFQKFTLDILFPLLKTSNKELEDFKCNPEEFVNLALDTCEKQFSKIFKTAAASYLEVMADNIDGYLTFVVKICAEAIDFSFQCTDLAALNEANYPLLHQFKDSQFVKYFPLESRVDVSLMTISILSYLVTKRMDLRKILEATVMRNCNELFNENLHR